MELQSKLKENTFPVVIGFVTGMLAVLILVLVTTQLDKRTADQTIGGIWIFFALIQLVVWLMTRNRGYLIWMFTCLAIAASYLTAYKGVYFFVPAVILITVYLYYVFSGRMRWRYRDILEIAARPVNDDRNGFTPRPFPAGKAEYTREDLNGLGKYLTSHLIAFPVVTEDGIVFMIKGTSRFLFRKPDIHRDTYIVFGNDGRIAVNMAQNDYKKYRSMLTFDHLCASLGQVFKTFLGLYREGKEEQIISFIKEQISGKPAENDINDLTRAEKKARSEI
jgi:hypothetical protein